MKWITTTSYDLDIAWMYNEKEKEKENSQTNDGRFSYTYYTSSQIKKEEKSSTGKDRLEKGNL
tara:strand:- start:1058 stop:1246 length:189 start_codon:yes stop_codon:yes gene_type:complete